MKYIGRELRRQHDGDAGYDLSAAHKTSLTLSEVSALEARIYDIVRGDQDE